MKRFLSIILTIVVLSGMTVPVMAAEAGSLESWGFEKNNGVDGEVVLDNSVVHSGKAAAKITRKIPEEIRSIKRRFILSPFNFMLVPIKKCIFRALVRLFFSSF